MNNTVTLLKTLTELVDKVNSTNSTSKKVEILQLYPQCQPILALVLNPLQTTGVTRTQIEKYEKKNFKKPKDVNDKPPAKKKKANEDVDGDVDKLTILINKLYTREYSGHAAYEAVIKLLHAYPDYRETILRAVEKNFKWRMDVKQINKAFPDLIRTFNVALANDFEKDASKKFFEKNKKQGWKISRKYDGVRTLTIVDENLTIKAYSRNGNEFVALSKMTEALKPFCKAPMVLDGEICSVDDNGVENFVEAVSQVKRKSEVMDKFRYYIFDGLTLDEFYDGESDRTLSERTKDLTKWMAKLPSDQFRMVEQVDYSEEAMVRMKAESAKQGWEGLMLRLDAPYKGKRSNDILKVKNFFTEEYVVTGTQNGTFRIIDPKTKLEVEEEMMASVTIEHKGQPVSVGSGFSIEERKCYFKKPKEIIGKTITVRYFEESHDSDGKISLRFPTFKCIWNEEDGRDV